MHLPFPSRARLFLLLLAVLFSLVTILPLLGCASDQKTSGRVMRVIDGDTIVIEGGLRVRYIGIDTPEIGEFYYQEARDKNKELVEGKVVRLEKDISERDRFGRLLRYVYVGKVMVNAELVAGGYARAVSYPPDTGYQERLDMLQDKAQKAGRGIWKSLKFHHKDLPSG